MGGPSNDFINVIGNLTLAGTLSVFDSGGFTLGSYRLFNYSGTLTNNGLAIGLVPAGFVPSDFTIQTSIGGQVNLIVGGANVLFWDGSQVAPNNAVDGGTGTWNTSNTNWTNVGGSANAAWAGRFSVFTGAAGVVTLTENVTTTGMQFLTDGYSIGAGAGAAFTLNGATMFRVDPGLHATISAPLTGAGSLTKMDTGTLTLAGTNTYTGGTTVADGVLIVQSIGGLGTGPVTVLGTPTSELAFVNSASAGGVAITNVGGGPFIGLTAFFNTSTAGNATITNQANIAVGGFGGYVVFNDNSNAGSASITNAGGVFNEPTTGWSGGRTFFYGNSSAANAIITNFGATTTLANGGFTNFNNSSTAGASFITNLSSPVGNQAGYTLFSLSSNAGTATIRNEGGLVVGAGGGATLFADSSNAGSATITASGPAVSGAGPGVVQFSGTSSAGSATIIRGGRPGERRSFPSQRSWRHSRVHSKRHRRQREPDGRWRHGGWAAGRKNRVSRKRDRRERELSRTRRPSSSGFVGTGGGSDRVLRFDYGGQRDLHEPGLRDRQHRPLRGGRRDLCRLVERGKRDVRQPRRDRQQCRGRQFGFFHFRHGRQRHDHESRRERSPSRWAARLSLAREPVRALQPSAISRPRVLFAGGGQTNFNSASAGSATFTNQGAAGGFSSGLSYFQQWQHRR